MSACTFICGDDEFLVTRRGKELFEKASADCVDEFSVETLDGMAQTVDEVANAVAQTLQATQTLSLFGGKKTVWLKGVSFLSDKRPGNTEGAKAEVAKLQEAIAHLTPDAVSLIITAFPVDRRRKEFKWFQKNSQFTDIKSDPSNLFPIIENECKACQIRIEPNATQALIDKVGSSTRLLTEEIRKLATYLKSEQDAFISERLVADLVPNFGEGDFFESTEAFYSLDLNWTLEALNRHFFIHKEARPVIASLQKRNRLLIQLRALLDAGAIHIGPRGIPKASFEQAAATFGDYFEDAEKSALNIFTQNPFYLGKISKTATVLSLKKLISIQEALLETFEAILARPNEQHAVMNALAVRCLS